MQNHISDRRREPRVEAEVQALLHTANGGETYRATTVNISSGGLLLKTSQPHPFKVGDDVVCELRLPNSAEQAFSCWGVGRVVRASKEDAALELKAGVFPPES